MARNEFDAHAALTARADALKARRERIVAAAEGQESVVRFRNAVRVATDIWAEERKLRAAAHAIRFDA